MFSLHAFVRTAYDFVDRLSQAGAISRDEAREGGTVLRLLPRVACNAIAALQRPRQRRVSAARAER